MIGHDLFGQFISWLIDWLVDQLIYRMIDLLVDCFIVCNQLIDGDTSCLCPLEFMSMERK